MRTIAGPNTNALRSITGYNVGSPLRNTTMPTRPAQQVQVNTQQPKLQTNTGSGGGGGGMSAGQAMGAAQGAMALGTDISAIASNQIPAQSAKGEGGRILGETAKYAAMGMAFGPIGAGVGALVGLTVGLVKNKKAKEAHKEQMAENKRIQQGNAAQQALAANVNAQSRSNITKTMPYSDIKKKHMAPTTMSHLKKLAPIPYGSNIKMSAKEAAASDLMMKVSGASDLTKHEDGHEEEKKDKIIEYTNPKTGKKSNVTVKPDNTVTRAGNYVGRMNEDGEIIR